MNWVDAILIMIAGVIMGAWFTWWVMVPPIGRAIDQASRGNFDYDDFDRLVEWSSRKDKETRGRQRS